MIRCATRSATSCRCVAIVHRRCSIVVLVLTFCSLLQFRYGDDGLDPSRMEADGDKPMDFDLALSMAQTMARKYVDRLPQLTVLNLLAMVSKARARTLMRLWGGVCMYVMFVVFVACLPACVPITRVCRW